MVPTVGPESCPSAARPRSRRGSPVDRDAAGSGEDGIRSRADKDPRCAVPDGDRHRMSGAAPSKLRRSLGDRFKNGTRAARQPTRLLHLGHIVAVAVTSVEPGAGPDLVQACEDCRRNLISARYCVSNALYRNGLLLRRVRLCERCAASGCATGTSRHRICNLRTRRTRAPTTPYSRPWSDGTDWSPRSLRRLPAASAPE